MLQLSESAITSPAPIRVYLDTDLKDLTPRYLENRRKDIIVMWDALEQGNFQKVQLLGHSMKGTGAAYGFDQITAIGRKLEYAARDNDSGAIHQNICELTSFLDRLEVVWRD